MKQKKETKIEKQRVQIRDVPYIYFDRYMFDGDIETVASKILGIKDKLKKACEERDKQFLKTKNGHFVPFNQYKEIKIELEIDYHNEESDVKIRVYRDETDEELKNRIEANKNKSIAAKKAAETRKLAQEKREKTLFENLKKKYGE